MTHQQIDFFISIADTGSFTATADAFFTTQPTVSRQLGLLEEELGFRLLERNGKRLRLTVEGEIMLSRFRSARTQVTQGLEQVARARSGLLGSLSVGLPSGTNTGRFILPEACAFSRNNPEVELSVFSGSFSDLRRQLDGGQLDVIFTFTFELPSMEQVCAQPVYRFDPLIVMAADHPLAGRSDLTADHFRCETFLTLRSSESSGRERQVTKTFEAQWGAPPAIRFMPNINSLLFGIRAGWGVAALDSSMRCATEADFFCHRLAPHEGPEGPVMAAVWKRDRGNPLISALLSRYPHPDT